MKLRTIIATTATVVAAVSLAGCVSLFPKTKPVQLYSFKAAQAAAAAAPAPPASVAILRAPTTFTRAASSDRILTRNGNEAAFIADARWSAPAAVLFDETLAAAFDNASVRLATRGESAATDAILRVEVRTFEAVYKDGPDAAPTAVVEARATLTAPKNREFATSKVFHAEHKANDNRTGPIVDAYDAAVGDLMTELVRWTGDTAKPAPKP